MRGLSFLLPVLAACSSNPDAREDLVGHARPGTVVWLDYRGSDSALGGRVEISIGEDRSAPYEIVPCGSEVDFVNAGRTVHAIRAECAINAVLRPGERVTRVFSRGERLRIRCPLHGESFWLIAAGHPYYAVADASGRFVIPAVPVGRYTLSAWSEARGEREFPIDADGAEVSIKD
jgi:nitrite reductase/ring-hydroxylating ferredoxin subunit